MSNFDLIVLGGGNAAALARQCANAGWNVALIEGDLLGGTCPNRGCIPSKLFLGFSEVATTIAEASRFYIDANTNSIDHETIRKEVFAATIDKTDSAVAAKLPENCKLYRGYGKFTGERQIEVNGETLQGKKIVIAVGTKPVIPKNMDTTDIWTSDDVFEMKKIPGSIAIVGGGYIACELAWFFSSIGVKTTMHVRSETLLRNEDEEIQAVFKKGFIKQVDVHFNSSIDDAMNIGAEKVLFALGRQANTEQLNLSSAGVKTSEKGFIVTDEYQKTSAEGVYALGDVTGRYFFTHSASWEAKYLESCFLRDNEDAIEYGPMPHAVFSYPEVAGVGKTEQELKKESIEYHSVSLPYSKAAKGRAIKEEHGLCKFLLKKNGEILGCHIVGHQASVLIHEVIPVMHWRNNVTSITGIIHIHPGLSELVKNTARKGATELGLYPTK